MYVIFFISFTVRSFNIYDYLHILCVKLLRFEFIINFHQMIFLELITFYWFYKNSFNLVQLYDFLFIGCFNAFQPVFVDIILYNLKLTLKRNHHRNFFWICRLVCWRDSCKANSGEGFLLVAAIILHFSFKSFQLWNWKKSHECTCTWTYVRTDFFFL